MSAKPSEKTAAVSSSSSAPGASLLPSHDQIARRAYEIYMSSGYRDGHCVNNWLQAEQELQNEAIARARKNRLDARNNGDGSYFESFGAVAAAARRF